MSALRRTAVVTAVAAAVLLSAASEAPLLGDLAVTALTGVRVDDDLGPVLAALRPGTPEHLVLVGSDRREDGLVTGAHADAVLLLSAAPSGRTTAVSLPRNLRVESPAHGPVKLSQSLALGRSELVLAVRGLTGLPLHGYLEVDLAGLAAAVDGVGGVYLDLDAPARDSTSGLDLPAGRRLVDGAGALAYVRSRQHEQWLEGAWRATADGDLGRIGRQHRLLMALLPALPDPGPDLALLARSVGPHMVVDRLATARRALAALPVAQLRTLPTVPTQPDAMRSSPFRPAHNGAAPYVAPTPTGRAWLSAVGAGSPLESGSADAGAVVP